MKKQSTQEDLERLTPMLEKEGYHKIMLIPEIGICGLLPFAFTIGLVVGLDETGYKGRYCYDTRDAFHAVAALALWDGKGDPIGPWIKYKGRDAEYSNPRKQEHEHS